MREWWDLSGRNIATALVGKLLPYYVVLMLMSLMVGILDVWLGVARGNAVLTAMAATLDHRLSDGRLPDAVAGATWRWGSV
jgi:hypothetical protein